MTAYSTLDKDALRSLLTTLRGTSWSWDEVGVPALAARFGWNDVETVPGKGAVANPGYGLGGKSVRLAFGEGRVKEVVMQLTPKIDKNSAEDQLFLSDFFTDVLSVATDIFGEPTSRKVGDKPEVRWRTPETTIVLKTLTVAVTLTWRTTAYQDEWDELARRY